MDTYVTGGSAEWLQHLQLSRQEEQTTELRHPQSDDTTSDLEPHASPPQELPPSPGPHRTMAPKRRLSDATAERDTDDDVPRPPPAAKRRRLSTSTRDRLSPLSDELLVRILSLVPLATLLSVAPVSRRFRRLTDDSQLWKRLYYARFVLPRALRLPGFRTAGAAARDQRKLLYSARCAVWADGQRGGWVDLHDGGGGGGGGDNPNNHNARSAARDWKSQYKLRHNWAQGKCAVEELAVGEAARLDLDAVAETPRKMLVKVSEGIAVTADATAGLRAWHLRTRRLVAQTGLDSEAAPGVAPSCLAIDDQHLPSQKLDIAVGFSDGSFGIWQLHTSSGALIRRYRHEKSTNGELVGAAFSYPYLLTATHSVLISLYTFDRPQAPPPSAAAQSLPPEMGAASDSTTARKPDSHAMHEPSDSHRSQEAKSRPMRHGATLEPPYLLTSLKSHTSRAPLTLSIRKTAASTIASIAYTFSTLQGWSLGIQDLHLRPSSSRIKTAPEITTTRLAYTPPMRAAPSQVLSPPSSPRRPRPQPISAQPGRRDEEGPISLSYMHPYLLATLPDNTLILYLCTSNATSLAISSGIRLWGHTSGISDAEITSRGKAVSVSCRGEEIRVWELEGRAGGSSIEVRATGPTTATTTGDAGMENPEKDGDDAPALDPGFDERRNWVGFDDEMVIVLKESGQGRESLLVYDFT